MKLQQVTYDENTDPATATYELTIQELALIQRLIGQISDNAITAAMGPGWTETVHSIYIGASQLTHVHYEDGINDIAPPIELHLHPKP